MPIGSQVSLLTCNCDTFSLPAWVLPGLDLVPQLDVLVNNDSYTSWRTRRTFNPRYPDLPLPLANHTRLFTRPYLSATCFVTPAYFTQFKPYTRFYTIPPTIQILLPTLFLTLVHHLVSYPSTHLPSPYRTYHCHRTQFLPPVGTIYT